MKAINLKKTINKAKSLAALSLALFAFASCSGLGDDGSALALAQAGQAQAQTAAQADAYVTLSLFGDSFAGGVSANTQADATSATFGKFELNGTSNDAGVEPVSWSCGDGATDAKPGLANAKVPVKKGASYTFTLTATAIGGAVYTATDDITIQAGANTLSFTLVLVNSGSAGAKGSAQIDAVIPQGTGDKEVKRGLPPLRRKGRERGPKHLARIFCHRGRRCKQGNHKSRRRRHYGPRLHDRLQKYGRRNANRAGLLHASKACDPRGHQRQNGRPRYRGLVP